VPGSLQKQNHPLASAKGQIELLNDNDSIGIPLFEHKLNEFGLDPLKPTGIDILQINVGKMCNQVCAHCHVDAGPDRKEIMTRETMQQCLEALAGTNISTIDLTGGAPEMNPHFRWFVEKLSQLEKQIIVRCNLTIILAHPRYNDLPGFFKKHKINVVSSLPYFNARRTDAQRGEGVFDKSVKALRMLNAAGYGKGNPAWKLDLVYNPAGAFLPGDQTSLENQFKRKLAEYDIVFDDLFSITNLPISRFLEYLVKTEKYEDYMTEMVNAFNPTAAANAMCRNTVSIGWDGYMYDCDFNQMLELKLNDASKHIKDFNLETLASREIIVNQHCFGCAAGAGSSCGGATT